MSKTGKIFAAVTLATLIAGLSSAGFLSHILKGFGVPTRNISREARYLDPPTGPGGEVGSSPAREALPTAMFQGSELALESIRDRIEQFASGLGEMIEGFTLKGMADPQIGVPRKPPMGSAEPMFWSAVYPGVPYTPTQRIAWGATLNQNGGEGTELRLGIRIDASRVNARFSALSDTFGMSVLPPATDMPMGTFSGYPLGERAWASAPKKKPGPGPGLALTARLVAYDGHMSLRLDIDNQPKDAYARTLEFEEVSRSNLLAGERLARIALSCTYRAFYDFGNLPQGEMSLGSHTVSTKEAPRGVRLVRLQEVAQIFGARLAEDHGIWTTAINGKASVAPLAARVAIVDGKEVALDFPIVQDGDGVWIDAKVFQ